MKLLYVCTDFGIAPSGVKGASVHVRAITRALSELGHDVHLLSPRGGPGQGHPVRNMAIAGRSPVAARTKSLRKWLKHHDLPTSISQDLRPLLYNEWVTPRAIRAMQDNPPDVIIERLSLLGHVGLDLAREFRCPYIVEVNALLTREASTFRSLAFKELAEEIETRVLSEADAIVPVSQPLADHIRLMDIEEEKIRVIPNGADVDQFDPEDRSRALRRRLGLHDSPVVGFLGSLKPWHGVDLLISSFSRLRTENPDVRLLIVGTGPTEKELVSQVERAGLTTTVVFAGAVKHNLVPKYLAAMDVVVAPFVPVDGFYFSPIKLFEYMAAGCCTVASNLGQISEIIHHGDNGLLFSPNDLESLTACLRGAVNDEMLRTRLGATARACVENHYTWDHAARAMNEVMADAMDRMSGAGERSQTRTSSRTVINE